MARKTMYSFDSADSVEWCPYEPYTSILATGTYQVNKLDKDTEKIDEASEKEGGSSPKTERLGRIYLHRAEFTECS